MKIVFLNAWEGKVSAAISDFIRAQTKDTDVFCFQEAGKEMQSLVNSILSGYDMTHAHKYVTEKDDQDVATYVKKGLNVTKSETVFLDNMRIGAGIYTQLEIGRTKVNICNFHGLSRPIDKLDEPGRVEASQAILNFFAEKDGVNIIGGDFNLLPNTTSVQMFESNDYVDLIRDYKIPTTRNRLIWELYPATIMKHSDYVFVDKNVRVKQFLVPNNEISDHLPMILEVAI